MDDHNRLMEFVPGRVWTKHVPLTFYGLPIGTRMTVVRLPSGQLFLHSPAPLDPELQMELERLGTVHFVIAPNRLHHLYLGEYVVVYPEAHFYASTALPKKRPDLPFHGVLEDLPEPEWGDMIDQVPIRGSAFMDEVVFLERHSRTLIVADLLQCVTRSDPWFLRAIGWILGVYGTPGLTRDQRLLMRDRASLREAVQRILSWDFDRIIMAHGPLVEFGGKELFRAAFRWL